MILRRRLTQSGQIRILGTAVREQITATHTHTEQCNNIRSTLYPWRYVWTGGLGAQVDSQSLSVSINEGLEQGFVVGDGLQDVPICRHVSDRPLAQPSAAEPENVAERRQRRM